MLYVSLSFTEDLGSVPLQQLTKSHFMGMETEAQQGLWLRLGLSTEPNIVNVTEAKWPLRKLGMSFLTGKTKPTLQGFKVAKCT